MRTREEITREARNGGNGFALLIEIALDIRDFFIRMDEERQAYRSYVHEAVPASESKRPEQES